MPSFIASTPSLKDMLEEDPPFKEEEEVLSGPSTAKEKERVKDKVEESSESSAESSSQKTQEGELNGI